MSFWRAPALMRVIQRRRKSRFLFLRSRYAYLQPRSTVSLAAFQSLLRPPYAPRAAFMICFFRFRRGTFDRARGMCVSSCYAWSSRFMRFTSPRVAINALRRRLRFRLDVFLVRMWRLWAWPRFTSPRPVRLKRFRAPLWDFIFGIVLRSLVVHALL